MPLRHMERGGIALLISNLGTRQEWPVSVTAGFNLTRDMDVCLCECCVSECDCDASIMTRPWFTRGCCAMGGGGGERRHRDQ